MKALVVAVSVFVFSGSSAKARSQDVCEQNLTLSPVLEGSFGALGEHMHELHWWGANDELVDNAKCSRPGVMGHLSMITHLNKKHYGNFKKANVHGIELEDNPAKIELLKKLLTVEDITFYGQIEDQPKYTVPSDCKRVKCAAQAIFGDVEGVKLLYALDKYGMNMSHLRVKDTRAWKNDEIDNVLEALDDLPETMIPFERDKMMGRHKPSFTNGTLANATIMFFDEYGKQSEAMQRYTVVHELGHNVGNVNDMDESPEWLALGGWIKLGSKWISNNEENATSLYGQTNPGEDFAETFAAYRYNPSMLKEVSPEKYEFMKNYVFQGLEYDKEENCQESNAFVNKIAHTPAIEEVDKYNACKSELVALFNGTSSMESMRKCMETNLSFKALDQTELSLPEGIDQKKVKANAKKLGLDYTSESIKPLSDELVVKAYQKILDDSLGAFVDGYFNFGGCDRVSQFGYQNFDDFGEKKFGDEYLAFRNKQVFGDFTKKVCEKYPKEMQLKADTPGLKQMFYDLIPTKK